MRTICTDDDSNDICPASPRPCRKHIYHTYDDVESRSQIADGRTRSPMYQSTAPLLYCARMGSAIYARQILRIERSSEAPDMHYWTVLG